MQFLRDPFNYDLTDPSSIPNLILAHLSLTLTTMLLALLIAFPIAFLILRFQRLYLPVITLTGILYTIPSLAAVVLLEPITGLNPPTIIIPMVAYAQIVLVRNIVAAIKGIDPALLEYGRAMGMNATQLQLRVVLPLAVPVMIAGVRVATVTTIGITTIGSLVGVPTLGDFIFKDGIYVNNYDTVFGGAILITVLAVVADLVLLGVQRLLSRGRNLATAV